MKKSELQKLRSLIKESLSNPTFLKEELPKPYGADPTKLSDEELKQKLDMYSKASKNPNFNEHGIKLLLKYQDESKRRKSLKESKSCSCGCNSCGNKGITINENFKGNLIVSKQLKEIITKSIPLHETKLNEKLINEVTSLYSRKIINLSKEDKKLIVKENKELDSEDDEEYDENYEIANKFAKTKNAEVESVGVNKDGSINVEISYKDKSLAEFIIDRNGKVIKTGSNEYSLKESKWEVSAALSSLSGGGAYEHHTDIEATSAEDALNQVAKLYQRYGETRFIKSNSKAYRQIEWPDEILSRYGEYVFKRANKNTTRARYDIIDKETGKAVDSEGVVFTTLKSLKAYAEDLIKPQGGRQSSQF